MLQVDEWKSLGRGALMAVGAALLAFLTQVLTAADHSAGGLAVAAVLSVAINFVRKLTGGTAEPAAIVVAEKAEPQPADPKPGPTPQPFDQSPA